MSKKTVMLKGMARVEGEGALLVTYEDKKLTEVRLKIFEPPRFFEAFLVGRRFDEAPDITARICGICPVAYQMSSINAMESIMGVEVEPQVRALRRALYFGEWIESHALHIHMLHAPDFLGYPDAIAMAADHGDAVKRGLMIKKFGNDVMGVIGGRDIHPINLKVGGFHSLPPLEKLRDLRQRAPEVLDASIEVARLVATLPFPEWEEPTQFVAMSHAKEYPVFDGDVACSDGTSVPVSEYETVFEEFQAPHSHALHSRKIGGDMYQVGPLARFNLCFDRLHPNVRALAEELGVAPPVVNPFKSIIVRSLEMIQAVTEVRDLIEGYAPPARSSVPFDVVAGEGCGGSEAPRGLCWHRYRVDSVGRITFAKIVPPTAQNQPHIEADLRTVLAGMSGRTDDDIQAACEKAVRNYDPCISCATHFLKVTVHRR